MFLIREYPCRSVVDVAALGEKVGMILSQKNAFPVGVNPEKAVTCVSVSCGGALRAGEKGQEGSKEKGARRKGMSHCALGTAPNLHPRNARAVILGTVPFAAVTM